MSIRDRRQDYKAPDFDRGGGSGGGSLQAEVDHSAPCDVPALEPDLTYYERATELLGGLELVRPLSSRVDVHDLAVAGMPYAALHHLLDRLRGVPAEDVAHAVGVSTRTLHRQRSKPAEPMPADLGSKAWQLAETLAKAEDVLGSHADAERWMTEPAMGLDGKRPIDLLQTGQGAQLVDDFLERLQLGVYN